MRGRRFPRLDRSRLARGFAAAGTDLRFWASRGTVSTHDGDTADPNAVLITPAGIEVDVILEPASYPTTCWYGMSAGTVFEAAPIHSGDQVLVLIPDGDPAMIPEIIRVIPGKSSPIPVDTDGKPFFRNDRKLIYAKGVPIDLRTDGGARVLVNPDGTVVFNDGAEQLVLGTTYRAAEQTMNSVDPTTGLQGIWTAAAAVCVGPLAALKPFFLQAAAAVAAFEASSDQFLSNVTRTK